MLREYLANQITPIKFEIRLRYTCDSLTAHFLSWRDEIGHGPRAVVQVVDGRRWSSTGDDGRHRQEGPGHTRQEGPHLTQKSQVQI